MTEPLVVCSKAEDCLDMNTDGIPCYHYTPHPREDDCKDCNQCSAHEECIPTGEEPK